jgi:hypothetical protein
MTRRRTAARALATVALAVALGACTDDGAGVRDEPPPPTTTTPPAALGLKTRVGLRVLPDTVRAVGTKGSRSL